jgi:hypothetical protein
MKARTAANIGVTTAYKRNGETPAQKNIGIMNERITNVVPVSFSSLIKTAGTITNESDLRISRKDILGLSSSPL